MKQRFHCVAFSLGLVLVLAAAGASSAQNRPAPQLLDPKACADEQRLRPPRTGNAPQSPGSNQTLSEKLEQTEGVFCPPAGVDPEIGVAPPGGGKTPVIPPPGSPGGDPTVRPK
jgi:hypothetical protein